MICPRCLIAIASTTSLSRASPLVGKGPNNLDLQLPTRLHGSNSAASSVGDWKVLPLEYAGTPGMDRGRVSPTRRLDQDAWFEWLVSAVALVAEPTTKKDKANPKWSHLVVCYSAASVLQVVKSFSKTPQVCIAQAGFFVDLAWGEFDPMPYPVFFSASESHFDQHAKELDVNTSHV